MADPVIVMVWRREACESDPFTYPHASAPFDGVEVVCLAASERDAWESIEELRQKAAGDGRKTDDWRFLIMSVSEVPA